MAITDVLGHMFRTNCRLCLFDDICSPVVQPLAEGVRFKFRTCRPLVPIVEIYHYVIGHPSRDMTPAGRVTAQFPVLQGAKVQHDVQIGGLGQRSTYWYRITAGDAVDQGTFRTGSQNVSVYVTGLEVIRDGDPGSSGEMFFMLAAFDAVRGHRVAGPVTIPATGLTSFTDGQLVPWPLGRVPAFRVLGAPQDITLWAFGADADPDFGVAGLAELQEYIGVPSRVPPGPAQGATPGGDWEFATALLEVRVPEQDGGALTRTLDTGNTGVAYRMRVELRVGIEAPMSAPARWPAGPAWRVAAPWIQPGGALRLPGQVIEVEQMGRGRHLFALGPGGALLWQRAERAGWRRRRDTLWTRLGDGLRAIAVDMMHDGMIDLVGLTETRRCTHGRLDLDGGALPSWMDLEGPPAVRVVTVRHRDDRLGIFCLDEEGVLHERTLAGGRYAASEALPWNRRGEPFTDVQALVDPAGRLEVFALTPAGELRTGRPDDTGGDWEWQSLGGAFDHGSAILASLDPDGLLALAVVDPRRVVYVKIRTRGRWRPDGASWHVMGPMDILDTAAFQAVERLAR